MKDWKWSRDHSSPLEMGQEYQNSLWGLVGTGCNCQSLFLEILRITGPWRMSEEISGDTSPKMLGELNLEWGRFKCLGEGGNPVSLRRAVFYPAVGLISLKGARGSSPTLYSFLPSWPSTEAASRGGSLAPSQHWPRSGCPTLRLPTTHIQAANENHVQGLF